MPLSRVGGQQCRKESAGSSRLAGVRGSRPGLMALLWLAAFFSAVGNAAELPSRFDMAVDPHWVTQGTVPEPDEGTRASDGLRYLLAVDQVNLTGPKPVWHRRVSYRIEQERALASAGQVAIGFQPLYQRVQLHALEVWRDGVREDRLAHSRVEVLRREADLEAGLLDGRHTLSVTIPDLRVGDRVEYRFSVVGYNPVFGNGYYDSYTASYSDPLPERRVRFLYPREMAPRWRVTRPGFRIQDTDQGTHRLLEVSASNLPAIQEEDATPSSHDPYGTIQFSTAADWGDVARWASPLYPRGFTDRGLADSMARKLELDPADQAGSLGRAIAFVQGEVRYTGLDMGQNSHAPNPPELTVARRFGDCKDKASLLVALLREAGIEAEPVLVHTGLADAVRDQLPSPLAFNHVVVRAVHEGRAVWIDPTRNRERGPLGDREPLAFGYGLPVHHPDGLLVGIPREMPSRPLVDVEQRIALAGSGDELSADFEIDTAYRQNHADRVRVNFANNGPGEVGRNYLDYMRRFYTGLAGEAEPTIEESKTGDLVRTRERYRLAWSKAQEGNVFGVVLFQLSDWLPELREDLRRHPLLLTGPRHARHSVRVAFADGWSILPETDKVANPYFEFTRTVRVEGGELLVRGEWRRLADQVPARDYALVQRDFGKARELLQFDIEIGRGLMSALFADLKAWAWSLVALSSLSIALLAFWLARARSPFAGMLFRPRQAMSSVILMPAGLSRGIGLVVLAASISALVEHGSEYAQHLQTRQLAMAFGGVAGYLLQFFISIAMIRWAFHLLGTSVPYRRLLVSGAWASAPPFIVLMGFALVAVGGRIEVFADAHVANATELPGVIVAGVLAVGALIWMLVGTIHAHAAAASVSRRSASGAIGLAVLLALVILGSIGTLVFFLK